MLQIQRITEMSLSALRRDRYYGLRLSRRYESRNKCAIASRVRGRGACAGEINSFGRFHLYDALSLFPVPAAAAPVVPRFVSVIARHRRVIKNHGRGVNFRETENHGKFNPVIRPANRAVWHEARGYRNLTTIAR